ncbi:MAG: glycosyltransferase, partial [Candidatus Bathyarchaeia archaeon]
MEYLTEILHWTLFTLLLASCAYHLLCIRGASRSLCIEKLDRHCYTPPVSVLKPVRGLEPASRDCFASFCRQSYRNYEVIFAVQDEDDPAIAVIEQLIVDYPDRNIRLVVNPASIGASGKLSNLENALQEAKHQILVISDSDILVDPDYLKSVVAPFYDPKVGLVTCLYRASRARTLGGLLEAVGISAEFLPGVCAALHLEGLRFALGATIAMRRDVLEQIGG